MFSKKLTKHALIFRAFGRKLQIVGKFCEDLGNFWWKFNGKIEFFYIFGKIVAKNRAFGNNIFFLQQLQFVAHNHLLQALELFRMEQIAFRNLAFYSKI